MYPLPSTWTIGAVTGENKRVPANKRVPENRRIKATSPAIRAKTRARAEAIRKKLSQKSTTLSPFLQLVHLAYLVSLVCLVDRNKLNKPNEPNKPLRELLDTLDRADDIGQTDTVLLVHHHHFTSRNQLVIDQHFHCFARKLFQFDHGPLSELE
jgi:hypothetical protein